MRFASNRVVEWSIMTLVVLVLIGVFGRQIQIVQGQAEGAVIKSTLGALRTAFVLDHLKQQSASQGANVVSGQRNPFLLLESVPSNYGGELASVGLAPGTWAYDPVCICIGYAPVHSQFLENKSADPTLWFRVNSPRPPFQITPTERYIWQGEVLQ